MKRKRYDKGVAEYVEINEKTVRKKIKQENDMLPSR